MIDAVALIRAAQAVRSAQGLSLRVSGFQETPGHVWTGYAKDEATRDRWLADAQRRGLTVEVIAPPKS